MIGAGKKADLTALKGASASYLQRIDQLIQWDHDDLKRIPPEETDDKLIKEIKKKIESKDTLLTMLLNRKVAKILADLYENLDDKEFIEHATPDAVRYIDEANKIIDAIIRLNPQEQADEIKAEEEAERRT